MNAAKMQCFLAGGDCKLYAIGDKLVFGYSPDQLTSALKEYEAQTPVRRFR